MATTDPSTVSAREALTEAQQQQMREALSKGETPPNFGGVVTMDQRTGEWRKATKAEADAHYAAFPDVDHGKPAEPPKP